MEKFKQIMGNSEANETEEDLMNNFDMESFPEETKEEYISRILGNITRIGRSSDSFSFLDKKIVYAGRNVNEKVIRFFESSTRLKKFKDKLFEIQKKDNVKFSDIKNIEIFDTFLNKISSSSKGSALKADNKFEYYNKTNQLRNFFDRNRESTTSYDNHSYSLMMFGLPENFIKTEEGKEYLHNEIDDKIIFLFGGGDSIKDLLKSEEFKPKKVINFDPFIKEEAFDKNPNGIYESQMISASDKKIREMTEQNEIPKADEVWATYSVPFYLDSSEDIKELISNMSQVLNEGGNARICPISVQSTEKDGENFETRKQALIESVKSLIDNPDYNVTIFNNTLKIHKIKKEKNKKYDFNNKQESKSLLINDLDLSIRLYQFLKNSLGINSLNELSSKTEKEIRETRGFTEPNWKELKSILLDNNLALMPGVAETPKEGWVNDTEKYKIDIKYFILLAKSRNYNSLTEFHLSGMNSKVLEKIYNGSILPEKVEVFYKKNKPEQIHVSYNGEGTGHYIDFYISGKALYDFFSKNPTI